MSKKQELELTWIGKENRPKLEPRILPEDSAQSYRAKRRVASVDSFNNLLAPKAELAALLATFENGMFKYFTLHQRVAAT